MIICIFVNIFFYSLFVFLKWNRTMPPCYNLSFHWIPTFWWPPNISSDQNTPWWFRSSVNSLCSGERSSWCSYGCTGFTKKISFLSWLHSGYFSWSFLSSLSMRLSISGSRSGDLVLWSSPERMHSSLTQLIILFLLVMRFFLLRCSLGYGNIFEMVGLFRLLFFLHSSPLRRVLLVEYTILETSLVDSSLVGLVQSSLRELLKIKSSKILFSLSFCGLRAG